MQVRPGDGILAPAPGKASQTEATQDRTDPDLHSDGSERALILLQPNVTNPSQALARDIEHLGVKDITTKKQRGVGERLGGGAHPHGAKLKTRFVDPAHLRPGDDHSRPGRRADKEVGDRRICLGEAHGDIGDRTNAPTVAVHDLAALQAREFHGGEPHTPAAGIGSLRIVGACFT